MKRSTKKLNWDLLYAVLTSDPDPAVQQQWEQACNSNEQYGLLYDELKPVFEEADEPEWADLYKHLERVSRLHQATAQPGTYTVIHKRWWWMAAILVMSLTAGWWGISSRRTPEEKPVSWKMLQARSGQLTLLHFPDGSTVRLSPGSIIRFPQRFDSEKREVFLQGEAYFMVAKDSTCPFLVHSGPITTRVTGTSFLVTADSTGGQYGVKLVEGSVSLWDTRKPQATRLGNLLPGQAFEYDESNDHWRIEPMSAQETATIDGGGFVFKNTPLIKIARQLELYYPITIHFTNPRIQQLGFTAFFEKPSLNHILYVLEASGKITITRRQDTIIFSPKK